MPRTDFQEVSASCELIISDAGLRSEIPLAPTVYNFMVDEAKRKSAPVIEPAIVRGNAVGVRCAGRHRVEVPACTS